MKIQEKIKQLEKELAELKAECDKAYEIEYTPGETYFIDTYEVVGGYIGNSERLNKHGRYRLTKEGAESALKLQQRIMRLHALAEDLGGLKEFVEGERNYFVHYLNDRWELDYHSVTYNPGMVYVTEICANQILELLNSGEYKLEV